MKIGYARITSITQSIISQTSQLLRAGCDQILEEKLTNDKTERPELTNILEQLRKDDILVVTSLHRLASTLPALVRLLNIVRKKGAHFSVLNQDLNTTGANGGLIFNMMDVLEKFEQDVTSERTRKALETAKARGRNGGRPVTITQDKARAILSAYAGNKLSISEICQQFSVGRSSVYRIRQARARGEI